MVAAKIVYNVECMDCGDIFTPQHRSSLWWKARKRAEEGFLDALRVTGKECGCVTPRSRPNAPIRVLGYDDQCEEFDVPFDSFVPAIVFFRKMRRFGVAYITGVSRRVIDRIEWPTK